MREMFSAAAFVLLLAVALPAATDAGGRGDRAITVLAYRSTGAPSRSRCGLAAPATAR